MQPSNSSIAALLAATLLCSTAAAATELKTFPVDHALASETAKLKLRHSVPLYWGEEPYPQTERDIGVFRADEATDSSNKSDQDACDRALLSALIFLQAAAEDHDANAVVGIRSISNGQPTSAGQYVCDAGSFRARVKLRARVVKLSGPR